MAFADHYPLDEFRAISHLSWWRGNDVQTEISRGHQNARQAGTTYVIPDDLRALQVATLAADETDKPIWEAAKKRFQDVIRNFLVELRTAGRLAPTGGVRGRDVWPASAWNDFVTNKPEDYHTKWLMSGLANTLTSFFVRMDEGRYARKKEMPLGHHQPPTAEQVEKAWTGLCATFDAGNSDEIWRFMAIECQDQKTGDRCELHFVGWTAVLMRRNADHALEIAGDVGPIPLVAADFDVPTGDLLLTDYLRVEGMDKAIDFGDEEYEQNLDLSSEEGRCNRSIEHAKRHNMGYCQTTNTSVAVWRNPTTGALAIVQRWFGDESAEEVNGCSPVAGWENVGEFSCDMWRVTAVDAAVARQLTSDKAVDDYLALRGSKLVTKGLSTAEANLLHHKHCYANNVVRLAVQPGRWTIHCGDDFQKRLPRGRFGLPKGVEPWCVLTPPKTVKARKAA